MRKVFLLLVLSIFCSSLWAHEGELLSIRNVAVNTAIHHVIFEFEVENVDEILLKDVRIDLMAGTIILATKEYAEFPIDQFTPESFVVSADQLENVDPRDLMINVTRIFDIPMDWGGWHGIDPEDGNYNDIGDHEIFADAPWRMNIYDDSDNPLPVPINIVAHDGNQILIQGNKPHLEFLDIHIKKATDDEFGSPLNFNDLDPEEFDALFTAKSPDNLAVGLQSFDLSLPSADTDHSLTFKEFYKASGDYFFTNLDNPFWYFTFLLSPDELEDFSDNDVLDVWVKFTLRDILGNPYVRHTYLRVFRSAEPMPKIAGWLRGDTHVHTIYSQSIIEFGSPLIATKGAAKAVGIDWVITTDHTTDFDNWRDGNIQGAWDRLGEDVVALNAEDESVIFIRGQEVSLLNSQSLLVHFLAYPGYETPRVLPYLGDGGGDIQFTNVTALQTLSRLEAIDGFAYAAHPFANKDELPAVGGLWNVGDDDFPHDGLPFQDGNLIHCNNTLASSDVFSTKQGEIIQNGLKGAQIWGDRYSMIGEVDPYDPYNIRDDGSPRFEATPEDESNYLWRYRQGEEVVNFVNQKSLKLKNQNPELENFKYYFSAGTDAHGSFNYSNTSGFGTFLTEETEIEVKNLAFGNISCVAYCPQGAGSEGENALKAMHDGSFSLSDGPILILGVSTNGDDAENELQMGMDTEVDETDLDNVFVNFEFTSSQEFGALDFLRIFVGTEDGESSFLVDDLSPLGDAFNFSLQELMDEAGMALPMDAYFYVRAEVQTDVDYGVNSPRILEGENFHCFTNPVWLRVNGVVSGIHDELLRSFSVYPNPFTTSTTFQTNQSIPFHYDLKMFDVLGKEISSYEGLSQNQVSIERKDLTSGIYFLNLYQNGQSEILESWKLVVK